MTAERQAVTLFALSAVCLVKNVVSVISDYQHAAKRSTCSIILVD